MERRKGGRMREGWRVDPRVRDSMSMVKKKNKTGVQRSRHKFSSSYYQFLPKSGQEVY